MRIFDQRKNRKRKKNNKQEQEQEQEDIKNKKLDLLNSL